MAHRMTAPFILRYQEQCGDAEMHAAAAGTKTMTNVGAEQMDSDPDRPQYSAFGEPQPRETAAEAAAMPGHAHSTLQAERHSNAPSPITSSSVGTRTFTKVHTEQADEDPGRMQFQAIPQCSSS